MAHPLEAAAAAMLQTEMMMKNEINRLRQDLMAAQNREAVLEGKLEALEKELIDNKDRSDYYLRWNVEIIRQLNNIGMFVEDALKTARLEVNKGNGNARTAAIDSVEKALNDAKSFS